jgi:hypothetical protein
MEGFHEISVMPRDSKEMIKHCQRLGPQVRGCWAVDLLLGKS